MNESSSRTAGESVLQSGYNMDSLLSVYSTMDEEQQDLEKKQNQMIVCSVNCLYNDSTIFNSFPLPIGLIVQPFLFDSLCTLRIDQEPVRCEFCHAIASYISEFETNGSWRCSFCKTKSSIPYNNEVFEKNKQLNSTEQYRELSKNAATVEYLNGVMDYEVEFAANADIKAVIFLIDKSLSSAHIKNIQESLSIILKNASFSNYYIGLIVFGDVIEIYEMSGEMGEADVFSSTQMPTEFDEQFIRKHEREGSDRYREDHSSYHGYLAPITFHHHLIDILGTFSKKDENIHPISLCSFLSATKYAQLLFSTGFFSSGEVVVCSHGFFYDLTSDPYIHTDSNDWLEAEILRQRTLNYQTRLTIDVYLSGCMYNAVSTLQSLVSSNGGMVLLLSDPYQTDFINCLNRSFYFLTSAGTLTIHLGEGVDVERVLGMFVSSTIKKVHQATVVTIELGRMYPATSISLLLSSSSPKHTSLRKIPIQAELTYHELFTERLITRRSVMVLQETEDISEFLEGVDGSTTAVIIAKDLCSNLDTSSQVTESVKNGIDCLLSQVLKYYKNWYVSCEPVMISPSPPPPPPTLTSSASYSSFYSYTRTLSHGDMTTIIDPFDSVPSRSVYAQSPLDVKSSPQPQDPSDRQSMWSRLLHSLFSSSSNHERKISSTTHQTKLPPSLRSLPLYLYYLRRGCLFGDCFHNGDLLQLHRLLIASSSLQDSLRIILPRFVLVRDPHQSSSSSLVSSTSFNSPPPITHIQRGSGVLRGHRRGGSRMSGLSSNSHLSDRVKSMPDLVDLRSEVVFEEQHQSDCTEIKKKEDDCTDIKKREDSGCKYVAFISEENEIGSEYYLDKKWLQTSHSSVQPEYSLLSPESMALLSDAVVVLDTEREVFIWIGANRPSLEEDGVFSECLSLALSLTQERNPPSIIRVVREYSSNSRHVLCNLIPSHKDPLDIVIQTLPVLSNYSTGFLKRHCGKFIHTDDMSFREYMAMIYHFR